MIKTDIAIVGGGITGLWLHSLLKSRGYQCLLFEKYKVGSGLTLASQGMIHGGLKYNLDGITGTASKTISSMPAVWRACLSGDSEMDLSNVGCIAWQYHLFSDGGLGNKLSAFLGSRALSVGTRMLSPAELPPPFRGGQFKGLVYEIPDLILDTESLIKTLATKDPNDLIEAKVKPMPHEGAGIKCLILEDGTKIEAQYFVYAAGIGNEELIALQLDIEKISRNVNLEIESYEAIYDKVKKDINRISKIPSILPVKGGYLNSSFGYRKDPIDNVTRFHQGQDITVKTGTPIHSPADGIVKRAYYAGGFGNHIKLDHGNGYSTLFAHLSKIKVKHGQKVKRGDVIGLTGNTGRPTAPHLHYEVHHNGAPQNPLDYFFSGYLK